jgi:hypothetical protein
VFWEEMKISADHQPDLPVTDFPEAEKRDQEALLPNGFHAEFFFVTASPLPRGLIIPAPSIYIDCAVKKMQLMNFL